MKNLGLSFAMVLLLGACSSGTTVADLPFNITGLFFADYENASGSRNESFVLNIAEDDAGDIVGNIIFETDPSDPSGCAINALVTGFTSGFSVQITVDVTPGTVNENGEVLTGGGTINYQLTQSNNGNTLSGTYVSSGIDTCSNASGSGTVVMNR